MSQLNDKNNVKISSESFKTTEAALREKEKDGCDSSKEKQ